MARVTGLYKVTWEIPDKDIPDHISEDMEDGLWSDDEILGYFEEKGNKIKSEMFFDGAGKEVEFDL